MKKQEQEQTPIEKAAEQLAAQGEPATKLAEVVLTVSEEHLPVKLTPDEVRERGRELALKVEERAREEEDQKAAKGQMKSALDDMSRKIGELSRIVRTGEEPRFVAVEHRLTENGTMVESVRVDTGETLRSRRASDSERQINLFLSTVPEGTKQ
jgi:hypothetical protein